MATASALQNRGKMPLGAGERAARAAGTKQSVDCESCAGRGLLWGYVMGIVSAGLVRRFRNSHPAGHPPPSPRRPVRRIYSPSPHSATFGGRVGLHWCNRGGRGWGIATWGQRGSGQTAVECLISNFAHLYPPAKSDIHSS